MSSFGEKLFNVMASARANGPLAKATWIAIVNDFVEAERPLGKNGAHKPKKVAPINKMTDAQFMEYLQGEEHLAGIDIKREIGRCQFHFKAKGIVPSRMRLINWLNRADKTLSNHGRTPDARKADIDDRKEPPPLGWAEFMKQKTRDWEEANPNGGEPPGSYALEKGDFYGMPRSWRDECRKQLGD